MEKGRIIELKFTEFSPKQNNNGVIEIEPRDMTYRVGKSYSRNAMIVDEIKYEMIGSQIFFSVLNASSERGGSGEKMKKGWKTLSNLVNLRITHDCDTIINNEID